MNSDYVTALRVQQHQADLLRRAEEHRVALTARPCPRELPAPRRTARWRWRREVLPNCHPEVAGA
jgi:hypothetical protein